MPHHKIFSVCAAILPTLLLSISLNAQQMPPGNLQVNTVCSIKHGHSVEEIVRVARAVQQPDTGPNSLFYFRPMSTGPFSENFLVRFAYWDNMAHWASYEPSETSGPARHLRELLSCDNVNRTYWINRNVGSGNAYAGGDNDTTLIAARRCRLKRGADLA